MKVFLSPTKSKTTIIEYTDEHGVVHELDFNNSALAKTAFVIAVNDDNPIFCHLNKYLNRLPKDRQKDIFEILTCVHNTIEDSTNLEVTNSALKTLYNHLFDRIKFEEILYLLQNDYEFNNDISLPSSDHIKMKYESVSDNYTKEKTYIFSEYQELIALIIQSRIMFPIWAHYIEVFSGSLGTNYKEFEAFKLIEDSALFNNPAMDKLARYVKANTPGEGSKAAIIDFISSDDYPYYNLALVVVRKLCTMEIRNPGEKHPVLIMHISTHVREKISNNDKKQGSIIADKIGQDVRANSEERQISMYERFKIRDSLTVGQKVFLKESLRNPLLLVQKLDPTIDLEMANSVIAETIRMGTTPVEKVQKVILRNIIYQVAPTKAVELLDREDLVNCLGAAAAVLIHHGFTDIAQFCTATVIKNDGFATIATDQHQNKVTAELRERIHNLMPFQRSGKAKTTVSPIYDNVDSIFKEITKNAWHSNLPDHIIAPNGGPVIRRIKIPSNLRIRLSEFAIYIAERQSPIKNAETKLSNLIY